jgi:hypothetical protein
MTVAECDEARGRGEPRVCEEAESEEKSGRSEPRPYNPRQEVKQPSRRIDDSFFGECALSRGPENND